MRGRRGIVLIDDLVIIAVVGAVIFFCAGPVGKSIGDIFNGGGKNINKTMHSKASSTPTVLGVDVKGNKIIGYATTSDVNTDASAELPKTTLWDKIKAVFWVILALVIIAMVFPAGIVAKVMNSAKQKIQDQLDALQAKHDALKAETVKIVQSVQTARALVTDPVVKAQVNTALDGAQNDSTKALVADIKANGTITGV